MPDLSEGRLLIDGRWREGGGSVFDSLDPATGASVWRGAAANHEDVHLAYAAARRAQPDWAQRAPAEREALLRDYARELERRRDALAALIGREVGKPRWEAQTEVASMIGKIELSIRAAAERAGSRESAAEVGHYRLRHKPHGVLAVFGPYNFPGHLPNGHIVPALLAGNAVVYKPSEHAPAVAQAMTECWQRAGLPPGVLNLVQGERGTGEAVAAHPELDGLLFTGSAHTGALLRRELLAGGRLLALEMGGNNPLLVRELADVDAALHDVLQSAFITSGQRCTCARRLLLPQGDWGDRFLARLLDAAQRLQIGAWDEEPQPFMGPLVSAHAARQLVDAQDELEDLGGRVLLRLRKLERGETFVSPGIVEVSGITVPDEEHFGPLLQLIRYRDLDEAIDIANATRYGLAAGFFGDDETEYRQFFARSRAGIVNWNRPTTGASGALPFGGIGASGNHRPSAWYAADYCAYPVASHEAPRAELPAKLAPGLSL